MIKHILKDLNNTIFECEKMATFLQFITQPISEMLIENFYFYLPKIYETILKEISSNEQSEEFAIFITYTAKAKHVYLLMSCLYDMLTPATQRLIQLNHLEPYLMQPIDICRIRKYSTGNDKYLQLLGIYSEQKEVKEVIAIRYHKLSDEKFKKFIYTLERYQPLRGWYCTILQRVISTYVIDDIQDAIDYENIMNLYETYPFSESDIYKENFHLEILPKLTLF